MGRKALGSALRDFYLENFDLAVVVAGIAAVAMLVSAGGHPLAPLVVGKEGAGEEQDGEDDEEELHEGRSEFCVIGCRSRRELPGETTGQPEEKDASGKKERGVDEAAKKQQY